ncbi:glycolipid 2-alpha-mannosyltransferase-domain-containing protein [Mycena olivaceomarginata]|nr:glycolipid 2-alpha-mannosyltransferase-domain-containing protein [Mycena olivaceomarginata]
MPPTCTHHDALPIDVDNGGGSKEVLTNLALPASNNLLSISSVLLTTSKLRLQPSIDTLPDVKFHCTLPFDPFQYMATQGKVYVFTIALYEWSATIPTLWDTVKDFMKQSPDAVALDNTMGFLSENGGQDFNMCHCPLSSSAWTFSASSSPPSCYPFASISPLPLFFPFPVIAAPLHPPFPAMPPRSSLLPSSASHSLPTHPPRVLASPPSLSPIHPPFSLPHPLPAIAPPTLPSSYSSPLPPRSLANLLTPHPPVWSNFEITDLNFWRGLVYTKLFEFLDKTGGFYYEVHFLRVCRTKTETHLLSPNHAPKSRAKITRPPSSTSVSMSASSSCSMSSCSPSPSLRSSPPLPLPPAPELVLPLPLALAASVLAAASKDDDDRSLSLRHPDPTTIGSSASDRHRRDVHREAVHRAWVHQSRCSTHTGLSRICARCGGQRAWACAYEIQSAFSRDRAEEVLKTYPTHAHTPDTPSGSTGVGRGEVD